MPDNVFGSEQDLLVDPPWVNRALSQHQLIVATEGIALKLSGRAWAGGGSFAVVGAKGDAATLQKQVQKHEDRHAADNLNVGANVLALWDEKLEDAKREHRAFKGANRDEAEGALYAHMRGTPNEIADRLVEQWGEKSDQFHKTAAGKTTVHDPKLNEAAHAVTLEITQP
jgi:hypothetical protein